MAQSEIAKYHKSKGMKIVLVQNVATQEYTNHEESVNAKENVIAAELQWR